MLKAAVIGLGSIGRKPLKAEIQAFLHAIQSGQPMSVSGEDGIAALLLALAVVESGRTQQVIQV